MTNKQQTESGVKTFLFRIHAFEVAVALVGGDGGGAGGGFRNLLKQSIKVFFLCTQTFFSFGRSVVTY